ncbi:hypothetical protein M434DRAFT_11663 [Hypoxylon sp. CO27-5]|nr:hypothetical protein M434DRAFT_11663 [Hypoxylon sp. CO27-5]
MPPALLRSVFEARGLKEYFDEDPRFEFKGLIYPGVDASTFRVRYKDPQGPVETDFVVKKALNTQFSRDALIRERGHLKSFLGSTHIVKILDLVDNPLEKNNYPGEWVILEYLSNGTIDEFITFLVRRRIERLPNRVLWRFFLCLIRACCAMAWPRNLAPDQPQELEFPILDRPLSGLAHNDLHGSNVLIGEFLPDPEHNITPVLKFIDFGHTGAPRSAEAGITGERQNVWDIGAIMLSLIAVQPLMNPRNHASVQIYALRNNLESKASWIFRPNDERPEGLDEALGDMVGACLAVDPSLRPSLEDLSALALEAVIRRDARFYGEYSESDAAIRALCHLIVFER